MLARNFPRELQPQFRPLRLQTTAPKFPAQLRASDDGILCPCFGFKSARLDADAK
jgi:hypothetical protein